MKDDTKFYIAIVFTFLVLTLIISSWILRRDWVKPTIIQPIETEGLVNEEGTNPVDDNESKWKHWCLENPILCKG